jgi:hypothetical protein
MYYQQMMVKQYENVDERFALVVEVKLIEVNEV